MTEMNNILETFQNPPLGGGGASVYFLGIGGIGMSALARYFNSKGIKVSGYDKTATALTLQLEAEGMFIHYEDNVQLIDKNAKTVVYTPAIPADHTELNYYRDNNYQLLKRSEVLGLITKSNFNICVAGTHGKTTTSAMVAHILRDSGYGCNAFLGGIATNYNSNFWSSDKGYRNGGTGRSLVGRYRTGTAHSISDYSCPENSAGLINSSHYHCRFHHGLCNRQHGFFGGNGKVADHAVNGGRINDGISCK